MQNGDFMDDQRENAQRYKRLWRSLSNWLKNNSGWKVGGVAKVGSRRRGDFHPKSDMDIDFWISDPYDKQKVYDNLLPKLRTAFPGSQTQKGTSHNVMKFAYGGLKVDIKLVSKAEFDKMINDYDERI